MQEAAPFLFLNSVFLSFVAMFLCAFPLRKHRRKSGTFVYSIGFGLCILLTLITSYLGWNFQIEENVTLLFCIIPIFVFYAVCHRVSVPILLFVFLTAMLNASFSSGLTDGVYHYFFSDLEPHNNTVYIRVQLCVAAFFISLFYFALAKENGITVDCKAALPEKIAVSEPDLWVLLGNCVENAIEACNRQSSGEKFMKLRVKLKGGTLGIALDNSYQGEIKKATVVFLCHLRILTE